MIKSGMIVLVVVLAMLASSEAQRPPPPRPRPPPQIISDFVKAADGFKNVWEASNPANIRGEFKSTYANQLYICGQRRVRSRNDQAGGIVSTFDPRRRAWSHHEHPLNIGNAQFVVFTLASRPFMLTYDEQRNGAVQFKNLYWWSDRAIRWTPIRFDVDRSVITINIRSPIYVSVPDQDGSSAYISLNVVSSRGQQTIVSPIILILDLDFQRNGNIDRASLRIFSRIQSNDIRGVVFTANKDQSTSVAFARQDYRAPLPSGSLWWKISDRFEINRRNGVTTRRLPLSDPWIISPDLSNDRIFQVKNRVIVFGWELHGRGGNVNHIWSYDLPSGSWDDRNLAAPDGQYVVDQKNGKIYAVSWDQVQVATLS